jgi:Co/Zn/Cd efflux system component
LIVGITILFTKFVILDLAGAVGFLIYLLVQNLTNLDQTLPTKGSQITFENKHESEELDQQIIDEILEIPKIEKIYDLKIISTDGQKTIIGNLVVNNHSSQEDIYNIKQKAKKILKNNGLDESILETEYLAEFNERDEIKEKPEIQT